MIVAKYYREAALGQCLVFLWGRQTSVARELAPVRLRSSRQIGNLVLSEETGLQDLGSLRNPAGASSLATMYRWGRRIQ
ncbi:hypothetical protein AB7M29_002057 [Pseudomonas sp. F-14 TE3623]